MSRFGDFFKGLGEVIKGAGKVVKENPELIDVITTVITKDGKKVQLDRNGNIVGGDNQRPLYIIIGVLTITLIITIITILIKKK